MKIEERIVGTTLVMSPVGRLDGAGAKILESRIAVDAGRGPSRVVLDCGELAYISSAGLRALLVCAKTCLQEQIGFVVAALRPDCRTVVRVSGMLSFLGYHATVDAALGGDGRPRTSHEGGTGMELEERHVPSATVISLNGRLDGDSAPELLTRVSAAIGRNDTRVLLDCGGMTYVNSLGLRGLLLAAKACEQQSATLAVAALRPECRFVMEVSGFASFIDCHETCEAALAAFA